MPPVFVSVPEVALRVPGVTNLKPPLGPLLKAVELFDIKYELNSDSNSADVGKRNPVGQGLLISVLYCHKLLFCKLNQSYGVLALVINKALVDVVVDVVLVGEGTSVVDVVVVLVVVGNNVVCLKSLILQHYLLFLANNLSPQES